MKRSVLVFCAALTGASLPLSALAQQTSAARKNSGQLQEVVVTAERRAEPLVDVPISVVNLGAQQLRQANVQTLTGIAQLTPGLQFNTQGPWVQPNIRGVGTDVVNTGSSPNVGLYIDGFYVPNGQAIDTQLLNIESIQVLKGPQGTLFGANTTGGAILVTTRKPSRTRSAILDASYGSYNAQRYQAYATTGLTDKVAVDVAALYDTGDGYFNNIYTHTGNS